MSDILPNYDASLKLQQQGWDAARPVGTMIKLPEKEACFCHGGEKHWHAYDAVWDGKNWLPVHSQAGIELVAALRSAHQDPQPDIAEGVPGIDDAH